MNQDSENQEIRILPVVFHVGEILADSATNLTSVFILGGFYES